jgi:hypothetical protein
MDTNVLHPTTWKRLLITGALGRNTFISNKTPWPIGLFDLFSDFLQEVSYLAVVAPFGAILGAIVVMLLPASYISTPLEAIAIACWSFELLALIFAGAFVIRVLRRYPAKWLCHLIAGLACPMEFRYYKESNKARIEARLAEIEAERQMRFWGGSRRSAA